MCGFIWSKPPDWRSKRTAEIRRAPTPDPWWFSPAALFDTSGADHENGGAAALQELEVAMGELDGVGEDVLRRSFGRNSIFPSDDGSLLSDFHNGGLRHGLELSF